MTFGQFIQTKRKQQNISQQQLSDACRFKHRSEISRLEAGQLEWKLSQIVAIAPLFGTSASGLLAEFEALP